MSLIYVKEEIYKNWKRYVISFLIFLIFKWCREIVYVCYEISLILFKVIDFIMW